ncbi:MAG: hypothetical protein ACRCX8_15950 [Sarcina sp.]
MKYEELIKIYNKDEEISKGGRNRKLQLERVKKHFEISITGKGKGTNYEIIRKYSPEEVEENYIKDTYLELIKGIICNALYENGKVIEMTNRELLIFFGFLKNEFFTTVNNYDIMGEVYSDMCDEEFGELSIFLDVAKDSSKKIMRDCLIRLHKERLIDMQERYVLCKYTDKGKFIQSHCTDEERGLVVASSEHYALKEVGANSKEDLNFYTRGKFYKLVKEYLKENTKYDFYFIKYNISPNVEGLYKFTKDSRIKLNVKNIDRLLINKSGIETSRLKNFIDNLVNIEFCSSVDYDVKDYKKSTESRD